MKFYVGCLGILFFAGCSLFKNTRTELHQSHNLSSSVAEAALSKENDLQGKSTVIVFQKDTSNQDYAIQLWPKGLFTFSREHGFSGEAEKILITGNIEQGSTLSALQTAEQVDKGKTKVKLSEKKKEVADQKDKIKTGSPSWKWVIGAVILILLASLVVYKKIFH